MVASVEAAYCIGWPELLTGIWRMSPKAHICVPKVMTFDTTIPWLEYPEHCSEDYPIQDFQFHAILIISFMFGIFSVIAIAIK